MESSAGASFAALEGRGSRVSASDNEGYRVMLPSLPTGRTVVNTVFLHGDVDTRPYRVEDFRDALGHLALLPDVIALGAYQMNHVWAVTFKNAEAVKKILAITEMKVKGRRCLIIDPTNQDVRIKIHWVLYGVTDEEVRVALAPYGKVTNVTRERWRVHGVVDKGSTTRLVTLQLKAGDTVEDLPHQLRIAGEQALVVVPGRAPKCLRCHTTGHVRRECRVPRCGLCRRFGHDESNCVRTYANVAGPGGHEDMSEFVMDEAEAEDVATVDGDNAKRDETPTEADNIERDVEAMQGQDEPGQSKAAATEAAHAPEDEDGMHIQAEEPGKGDVKLKRSDEEGDDEAASKRPRKERKDTAGTRAVNVSEQTTAKEPYVRRSSLHVKPNVNADRKLAATPHSQCKNRGK
ncbi:uncharacterized protein LOC144175580 [Haemaphysalis longicornis]